MTPNQANTLPEWLNDSRNRVLVKKLNKDAVMPAYGTFGAACFDLHAAEDVSSAFGRAEVGTGLAFEIPPGFVMFIKPRSGLAFKSATHAFAGTVDADYRGEVKVLLVHERNGAITVKKGERIAQAYIQAVVKWGFDEVQDLSATERGTGGFGSTGA